MSTLVTQSHAKVNITLDVLSKRSDGYHNVKMIMLQCGLCDTISITQTSGGITIASNLYFLPTNEKNIAYKAAALFFETTGIAAGVHIDIQKRIPVSAGLAGGSGNAAAVLDGLNRLYQTGLSKDNLMELGAKLGADVPYCIKGGTMLAEGIGNILTPLPPMPKTPIVIVKPNFSLSTATVYGLLQVDQISNHPSTELVMNALSKKNTAIVAKNMANVLEEVSIQLNPMIADIKNHLIENGALGAMMSGSGPSVFGLFPDYETAKKALKPYRGNCFAYAGWTK